MLDGGVVIEEKDDEATPTSSSASTCSFSFSFLAQALRHSLLQSSRRRPEDVSHLTGVDRITLSQLAQVPFMRAFLYSERHISEQNSRFPELVGNTYFSCDFTSEHHVHVRGFFGGRPLPCVGILLRLSQRVTITETRKLLNVSPSLPDKPGR